MNFLKVAGKETADISSLCRAFSVSTCLYKPKDKAAKRKKLLELKVRRMKLKMRMIPKHPFNHRLPLTAKHVGPSRLGGSKAIELRMALHSVEPTGYMSPKTHRFVRIPEMVPEFIVPDLTDFKLKPYVPYNAPEINQSKFTARDLFDQCYAPQIEKDFKAGKITYEPTEDKDSKKDDT